MTLRPDFGEAPIGQSICQRMRSPQPDRKKMLHMLNQMKGRGLKSDMAKFMENHFRKLPGIFLPRSRNEDYISRRRVKTSPKALLGNSESKFEVC